MMNPLLKILSLIDLTSLNDKDTDIDIRKLCEKANTPHGHVAAVCVYPKFVRQAKHLLENSPVKIATVANFPHGTEPLDKVTLAIHQAITYGADEIDVVLPYQNYLSGKKAEALNYIEKCKAACGDKILKVILETGAFPDVQSIAIASAEVIKAGADFIKTSTGKIEIGATPSAATAMLMSIKSMTSELKRIIGFKASGGIRTLEQAQEYIALANEIMGPEWITPHTFRIGTSQLLDAVKVKLDLHISDKT